MELYIHILSVIVFLFFLDAQVALGVAPLCTIHLVGPRHTPVIKGLLPVGQQVAAPTAAGQLAAPLLPPACRLTPAWEQSWAVGRRNAWRRRRLLAPLVVALRLFLQYENLPAPPLHELLKLRLHSQKETLRRQQQQHNHHHQNLSPHHSYRRMLPLWKIKPLHLLFLPPPPHLHLLSLLLLCHLVQPARPLHRRRRRQNVFSLLFPLPQPRPSLQRLFQHEAPFARPRSTRRPLCPSCLCHLYCLETLRTGENQRWYMYI